MEVIVGSIDNEKQVAIYQIYCVSNRKRYVGSSVNPSRRWSQHRDSLHQNKHHAVRLQRAWNKYGEAAFEFSVIECAPMNGRLLREQYWLDTLKCSNPLFGFNSRPSATDGTGVKWTDEARAQQSARMKGQTYTEARRTRMSEAQRGEKSHRAKLTEQQVRSILKRYSAGEGAYGLAREHSVSPQAIYAIIKRQSWIHL